MSELLSSGRNKYRVRHWPFVTSEDYLRKLRKVFKMPDNGLCTSHEDDPLPGKNTAAGNGRRHLMDAELLKGGTCMTTALTSNNPKNS